MTQPHPLKRTIALAVAVTTILGAVVVSNLVWRAVQRKPRCEDATVHAETVGVASRVAGPLVKLNAVQGARVKAGDVLLEIDPSPFDLAVRNATEAIETIDVQIAIEETRDVQLRLAAAAAEADVISATAQVEERKATLRRIEPLAQKGFATEQELDMAVTAVASGEALLGAAIAKARAAAAAVSEKAALVAKRKGLVTDLALAELHRSFCEVRAPVDGTVINLDIALGTYAMPGMSLFKLLIDDSWSVDAPYREGELTRMRVGDPAEVRVMTHPGRVFRASIESIGVAVHQYDETVLGNVPLIRRELDWVLVAQRFPVRLRVEDADPNVFRMGATVDVVVFPSGQ